MGDGSWLLSFNGGAGLRLTMAPGSDTARGELLVLDVQNGGSAGGMDVQLLASLGE